MVAPRFGSMDVGLLLSYTNGTVKGKLYSATSAMTLQVIARRPLNVATTTAVGFGDASTMGISISIPISITFWSNITISVCDIDIVTTYTLQWQGDHLTVTDDKCLEETF